MSKQTVREQFGAQSGSYAVSPVHAQGASLARLVQLVKPRPEWRVLDIATGAGHTAAAFAPYVAEVVATDITPEMLEQTQRLASNRGLPNVRVETADAEKLPYANGHFDLVTCRIAPHHFEDISSFLSEVARVLSSGGTLALVDNVVPLGTTGDFVNALEKLRDPSHVCCLTATAWLEALRGAGLMVRHHEAMYKHIDFAFWAQRHGPLMQAYLLALIKEGSAEVAAFLEPRLTDDGITFRLSEGLFIAIKGNPP